LTERVAEGPAGGVICIVIGNKDCVTTESALRETLDMELSFMLPVGSARYLPGAQNARGRAPLWRGGGRLAAGRAPAVHFKLDTAILLGDLSADNGSWRIRK
jgi:hypothetical protein